MDIKKILKKIGIGFLCLLIVALMGLNIYQHQQIKKASQELNLKTSITDESTTAVLDDSSSTLASEKGSANQKKVKNPALASKDIAPASNKDRDDLNYQLDAAEEELGIVSQKLSEEEIKKAEAKKAVVELQKRSMKDPSYKKYMRSNLDIQYGDLFKQLNLSQEKLEKFKDLLIDEISAQQNIYVEMQLGSDAPTKEQQAELSERYQALSKEYEAKKNNLLEKNDYEKYQAYTERTGERYYVTSFMESLGAGEKLSDAQKNNLIEAMHSEVKNVRYEKADDSSESNANMYDEKSIARMLEYQDRRGEAYLKATQGLLTASQTEQFKAYLKRQRDMYESSMKMQALMYGSQSSQTSVRIQSR